MSYQLTPDKWMQDEELNLLFTRLPSLALRDRAYFRTLAETGMRASEALNLEARDIRVSQDGTGSIHVRTIKNGLDRVIAISSELLTELTELSLSGSLFPVTLRRMDQVWRSVRPTAKRLHSLRHTFGRNLYRQTRDINLVRYALGHTSITNTLIYVITEQEDSLAQALCAMRKVG